jgi:hypothetical protein
MSPRSNWLHDATKVTVDYLVDYQLMSLRFYTTDDADHTLNMSKATAEKLCRDLALALDLRLQSSRQ